MTDDEVAGFLDEHRVAICATNGNDGWPHLMPLWYVVRDGELWSWTYAKSQKVRNLERDPRATIQVEAGEQYQELRGVMMECDVAIEHDPAEVAKYGLALFERFVPVNEDVENMVRGQAPKRIGLTFHPTRIVSWDHGKLGGTY